MKDILHKLDGTPGVRGALVMTLDGVIVASIPEGSDHAPVAAFLSAVLVSIEKSAELLGLVPLQRLTLATARGRLLLLPVGDLALAVIADGQTDLSSVLGQVTAMTRRLLRQSKIDVPL
jgi:predicted regulator of Ras-like GTPase activity (Roadblock/LC7/MglB family)